MPPKAKETSVIGSANAILALGQKADRELDQLLQGDRWWIAYRIRTALPPMFRK